MRGSRLTCASLELLMEPCVPSDDTEPNPAKRKA